MKPLSFQALSFVPLQLKPLSFSNLDQTGTVLSSASLAADGVTLTLNYSGAVPVTGAISFGGFLVRVNALNQTFTSSGSSTITLDTQVTLGSDTIQVFYVSSSGNILDSNLNPIPDAIISATNNVITPLADITGFSLASDGITGSISYDETVTGSILTNNSLVIKGDGVPLTIASSSNTGEFILQTPVIDHNLILTLDYDNTLGDLTGQNSNQVNSITNLSGTNNVVASTAEFATAVLNADGITVDVTYNVAVAGLISAGGFAVTVDTVSNVISGSTGNTQLTLTDQVTSGTAVVNLAYTSSAGAIVDASSKPMQDDSIVVTNNVSSVPTALVSASLASDGITIALDFGSVLTGTEIFAYEIRNDGVTQTYTLSGLNGLVLTSPVLDGNNNVRVKYFESVGDLLNSESNPILDSEVVCTNAVAQLYPSVVHSPVEFQGYDVAGFASDPSTIRLSDTNLLQWYTVNDGIALRESTDNGATWGRGDGQPISNGDYVVLSNRPLEWDKHLETPFAILIGSTYYLLYTGRALDDAIPPSGVNDFRVGLASNADPRALMVRASNSDASPLIDIDTGDVTSKHHSAMTSPTMVSNGTNLELMVTGWNVGTTGNFTGLHAFQGQIGFTTPALDPNVVWTEEAIDLSVFSYSTTTAEAMLRIRTDGKYEAVIQGDSNVALGELDYSMIMRATADSFTGTWTPEPVWMIKLDRAIGTLVAPDIFDGPGRLVNDPTVDRVYYSKFLPGNGLYYTYEFENDIAGSGVVAPSLSSISDQSVASQGLFTLQPTDTTGTHVTYTKTIGPDMLEVDPLTGAINFDSSGYHDQAFHVGIKAENKAGESEQKFILKIGSGNFIYCGPGETELTIKAATLIASPGDVIVRRDGTSTNPDDFIDSYFDHTNTLQSGVTGRYTTYMSETSGGFKMDGGRISLQGTFLHPHTGFTNNLVGAGASAQTVPQEWIKITGFQVENTPSDLPLRIHNVFRVLVVGNYLEAEPHFRHSSECLQEGNVIKGSSRYAGGAFYQNEKVVIRRVIGRPDVIDETLGIGADEPVGGPSLYSCAQSRFENNIVLDCDDDRWLLGVESLTGAFGQSATGNEDYPANNVMNSNIALNVQFGMSSTSSKGTLATHESNDNVGYDIDGGYWDDLEDPTNDPGPIILDRGVITHKRMYLHSNTKWVDFWMAGNDLGGTVTFEDSLFEMTHETGTYPGDLTSGGNNIEFDTCNFTGHDMVNRLGSPAPTITDEVTQTNDMQYILYAPQTSALRTNGKSGGATVPEILYQESRDCSMDGDVGYSVKGTTKAWPVMNEEKAREWMRDFTFTGLDRHGVSGTLSGIRGYCVDDETLTNYVWGYKGTTCPIWNQSAVWTGSNTAEVRWQKPAEITRLLVTEYKIYVNGVLNKTVPGNTETHTEITGLSRTVSNKIAVTATTPGTGESAIINGYEYTLPVTIEVESGVSLTWPDGEPIEMTL